MQWIYDVQPGGEKHIPFAQAKALTFRGYDRSALFQVDGDTIFIHVQNTRALIRISGFVYGFFVRTTTTEITVWGSGTLTGNYAPRRGYTSGTLESYGGLDIMPTSVYNGVAVSVSVADSLSNPGAGNSAELLEYIPSVFAGQFLRPRGTEYVGIYNGIPASPPYATYSRWGWWSGSTDNGMAVLYNKDGTTSVGVMYPRQDSISSPYYIRTTDLASWKHTDFYADGVKQPAGYPAFGFSNPVQLEKSRYIVANNVAKIPWYQGAFPNTVIGAYSSDGGVTYTASTTSVVNRDYGAYGYAPSPSLSSTGGMTMDSSYALMYEISTGTRGRTAGVFYTLATVPVSSLISAGHKPFATVSGVVATQFNTCVIYKTTDYGVTYSVSQGSPENTAYSCPLFRQNVVYATSWYDMVGQHQDSYLYATTTSTLVRVDRWNLSSGGPTPTYNNDMNVVFYVSQNDGNSWQRVASPPITGKFQDAGPPVIYGGTITKDPNDIAKLGYLVFEVGSQLYKFFITEDSCTSWKLVWSKTVDEIGKPVTRLGWLDNITTPELYGGGTIKPDAASWT
jgi:hypothetical protein